MTIHEIYQKYYVKPKKGFLAYQEWTTVTGVKVRVGINLNRKLAVKVGSRRWCVKRSTLKPELEPQEALAGIKKILEPELNKHLDSINRVP